MNKRTFTIISFTFITIIYLIVLAFTPEDWVGWIIAGYILIFVIVLYLGDNIIKKNES